LFSNSFRMYSASFSDINDTSTLLWRFCSNGSCPTPITFFDAKAGERFHAGDAICVGCGWPWRQSEATWGTARVVPVYSKRGAGLGSTCRGCPGNGSRRTGAVCRQKDLPWWGYSARREREL